MIRESYQRDLAESIRRVESNTDAEVVAVVARRADNYVYISTLWAAFLALLLAPLLQFAPFWLEAPEIFIVQWLIFIALALLFRWRPLMMWLIPKRVKYWRASNLARRQFLEQELHSTKGRLGLLIFVAEAEHYVELLADRGLAEHIADESWQEVVEEFIGKVKKGDTAAALIHCIERCGELLSEVAPVTEIKNELPNHLVLI
jgi:putative membrane protein